MWLHRLAWTLVSFFGPGILPGHSNIWAPPLDVEVWEQLCLLWRAELGSFDSMAVVRRTQSERSGFMVLLLERGSAVAFVKVGRGGESGILGEAYILDLVQRSRPKSFSAPCCLGAGAIGEWRYLALSPLPAGPHRPPPHPPLTEIAHEIQGALSALPHSVGDSNHWRPMHGDMTPWNLRCAANRGLFLFDWEDARWGPPGADEVLYQAAAVALGLARPGPVDAAEAIAYWESEISRRPAVSKRDRRLKRALLVALGEMRS
jgi:hypothetical protein